MRQQKNGKHLLKSIDLKSCRSSSTIQLFWREVERARNNLNSKSDDEVAIFTEITNLEAKVTQLQQQLAEADPEVDRLHEQVAVLIEQLPELKALLRCQS